jgi:predicted nucleic acid-binding protein
MSPVLDASVFVAAISPNERHHTQAVALFESHPADSPYLVPSLFRLEVLSAFARRRESEDFLELVDALVRGPRFYVCAVDTALLDEAARMARRAGLRAYDAVYAALARTRDTELHTLDEELATRLTRGVPEVRVRTAPDTRPA